MPDLALLTSRALHYQLQPNSCNVMSNSNAVYMLHEVCLLMGMDYAAIGIIAACDCEQGRLCMQDLPQALLIGHAAPTVSACESYVERPRVGKLGRQAVQAGTYRQH